MLPMSSKMVRAEVTVFLLREHNSRDRETRPFADVTMAWPHPPAWITTPPNAGSEQNRLPAGVVLLVQFALHSLQSRRQR